jgi:hypothetical protein
VTWRPNEQHKQLNDRPWSNPDINLIGTGITLPEKAPPPWAPHPPYVSTMILRPVTPASP